MSTPLESFVCPQCGAEAKKPPPGETTRCRFCGCALSAPEPVEAAAREIIREVVREVVVTRDSGDDYRAYGSSDDRARRAKRVAVLVAIAIAAIVIGLFMVSAKGERDHDARQVAEGHAESDRQLCEGSCRASCERAESAKPKPEPTSDPGLGMKVDQVEKDVDDTIRDGNIRQCTTACMHDKCK